MAHIINLAVKLFDDMRYYNVTSRSSAQDYLANTHTKHVTKNQEFDLETSYRRLNGE